MNDPSEQRLAELGQRVVELESRLSFQEHAMAEMSDALAAARDEESRNALRLHRALEQLQQLRAALAGDPSLADPASEPPPPHY